MAWCVHVFCPHRCTPLSLFSAHGAARATGSQFPLDQRMTVPHSHSNVGTRWQAELRPGSPTPRRSSSTSAPAPAHSTPTKILDPAPLTMPSRSSPPAASAVPAGSPSESMGGPRVSPGSHAPRQPNPEARFTETLIRHHPTLLTRSSPGRMGGGGCRGSGNSQLHHRRS